MSQVPRTLVELLERAAGVPDTGLRFVDAREDAHWLAWSELHRRALAVSGGLQALGLSRGERVGLIFPTGAPFFEAFFGVLLCGAVPVPLYPPLRLGGLDEYQRRTGHLLAAVRARLVLADPRLGRVLGAAVRVARPALGCRSLDDLPAGAAARVDVGPEDLGLVQFSSGTTVEPKPVALSHRAIVAQATLLNARWPDRPGLRHSGLSWLPLYHDMGLIGCVGPALERPAVLTLVPPEAFVARPALWLRSISKYGATISAAPNFAYGLCTSRIRDEELSGVDLSCWRVALNGAETVVPAVARAFAERFGHWGFRAEAPTPVYGLSEAALAVTFSEIVRVPVTRAIDRATLAAEGRAVERAGGVELASAGRPLPGFTLRIVDETGREVPDDHVGRITVRGPTLMTGYLDRPEATAAALAGGWLDTGDLGFVHDGELYVTGRAKDMLLLCGRNHAPDEVEHATLGVAGVRPGSAVAVSWLPEGRDTEALLVFVEARRGTPREEFEVLGGRCARAVRLATGLAAERVVVVPPGSLPRTSSGKLRRGETLRRWLAGELRPPRKAGLALRAAAWLKGARP